MNGKLAALAVAKGREGKGNTAAKAQAKADRAAAEADLTAELAKPDTIEVTGA